MTADPAHALPPLVPERPRDAEAVERLILRAFGPGRFAKAADVRGDNQSPLHHLFQGNQGSDIFPGGRHHDGGRLT